MWRGWWAVGARVREGEGGERRSCALGEEAAMRREEEEESSEESEGKEGGWRGWMDSVEPPPASRWSECTPSRRGTLIGGWEGRWAAEVTQ